MRPPVRSCVLIGLLASMLLLSACSNGATATDVAPSPAAVSEVTKQSFGTVVPASAKGQDLYLYTVIIPAGEAIAPHTHPGAQLGHIQKGTLTYTVIDGEVTVIRDAGTEEESSEVIEAGTTTQLETGDTVIESKGMVHEATNDGSDEVQVLLASLFPEGAELSSPAPAPSSQV